MKKAVFLLLPLLAGFSLAQEGSPSEASPSGTVATAANFPVERVQKPTAADLYRAENRRDRGSPDDRRKPDHGPTPNRPASGRA